MFYNQILAKIQMFLLAKDMSPPKPSLLLLEMVEFGELLRESPSPSDSPGSLRLLGRNGRCALKKWPAETEYTYWNRKIRKLCVGSTPTLTPPHSYTPPKIQDHHEWKDSLDMPGYIAWFGQRAHLNDDKAFIQVMNKLNTLVAIEVLVESRGVWLHLLLCIRVILWGEAILRLKVWVVILLLFVCWVNQACVSCSPEERLTAQRRYRIR